MKKRLLAIIICVIAIIGGAIGFTGCSPENGAYYLMENGELKTEQFFKLNSGKWEDDDGASGTYKTENGKIRLYIVLFGQEEELVTGKRTVNFRYGRRNERNLRFRRSQP